MADELKRHIVERMLADVKILEQTGNLQASGAAAMRSHLEPLLVKSESITPYSIPASVPAPAYGAAAAASYKAPPPPPPPVPAAPQVDSVKALWAHAGAEADELAFEAGDIINVTERTSDDWWRGVVSGKPGPPRLFPSNYVEPHKVTPSARVLPPTFKSSTPYMPSAPISPPLSQDFEKRTSIGGAAQWQPGQSRFTSGAPAAPPQPVQYSSAPVPEDPAIAKAKKDKLKHFGGRIGDGAAHGAGAGLAFGIVNKIF